jgi:hypothetical protein
MQQRLLGAIQTRMLHWLHDYLPHPELRATGFVTAPGLAGAAGIKGALALAIDVVAAQH